MDPFSTSLFTPFLYPENIEPQNDYMEAVLFRDGRECERNLDKAFSKFSSAAIGGYQEAQYELALCYKNGIGAEQDLEQAFYWFESAALQGHLQAKLKLAFCYQRGLGVEKNLVTAFELFSEAAFNQHIEAQYQLGLCFALGIGVDQHYTLAADWFKSAAESKHELACFNLASCYEDGRGVARDIKRAIINYQLVPKIKEVNYRLGFLYAELNEFEKAINYYQQAATQQALPLQGLVEYACLCMLSDNLDKAFFFFEEALLQSGTKENFQLCLLALSPRNKMELAYWYMLQKDFVEATFWLDKAKNQNEKKAHFYSALCFASPLNDMGDWEVAIEQLDLSPRNVVSRSKLRKMIVDLEINKVKMPSVFKEILNELTD